MIHEWKFKDWLNLFSGVDLPIGDLAEDVSAASDFPAVDDYDTLYTYFARKGQHVVDAFIPVWTFYKASTRH